MDSVRQELHDLVDRVPDDKVDRAAADLRSLVRERAASWPPAWFGIGEGSADDVSERVDEHLATGFGRSRG